MPIEYTLTRGVDFATLGYGVATWMAAHGQPQTARAVVNCRLLPDELTYTQEDSWMRLEGRLRGLRVRNSTIGRQRSSPSEWSTRVRNDQLIYCSMRK